MAIQPIFCSANTAHITQGRVFTSPLKNYGGLFLRNTHSQGLSPCLSRMSLMGRISLEEWTDIVYVYVFVSMTSKMKTAINYASMSTQLSHSYLLMDCQEYWSNTHFHYGKHPVPLTLGKTGKRVDNTWRFSTNSIVYPFSLLSALFSSGVCTQFPTGGLRKIHSNNLLYPNTLTGARRRFGWRPNAEPHDFRS